MAGGWIELLFRILFPQGYQQRQDEVDDEINHALAKAKENNEERKKLREANARLDELEAKEPESRDRIEQLRAAIREKEERLNRDVGRKPGALEQTLDDMSPWI